MQDHFHSLKRLFDVLQVVGVMWYVVANYLNNSSSWSFDKIKDVAVHLRTPENVSWDQIFFCCKTSNTGTIGNRATAKGLPTMPW